MPMQRHNARLCALLALVLTACVGAFAATPEEEAKYRADIDEGISLLRTGVRDEIHRAIARFKSALKIKPESAEVYYWLALANSDLGLYPHAASNARDATTYDDRLGEAWSLWGQVLLYQKAWSEALQKLETAQRLMPEDPIVHYNLGRVHYYGTKDYSTALSNFRVAWQMGQALRHNNADFAALSVNSRLYMGLCEYERGCESGRDVYFNNATNAFLDVLKEQPSNYDVALRLAAVYRKSNRVAESISWLVNLAKVLEQSQESINRYRSLLAEVYLQLADIYIKEPGQQNDLLAQANLNAFVNFIGDSNHPALEPAKQYLAEKQR